MELRGIDEGIVVHCETIELAKKCCKIADEYGRSWKDNESYLQKNNWSDYKERTCYDFMDGTFCSIRFAIKEGYTTISANAFIELNEIHKFPIDEKVEELLKALENVLEIIESPELVKEYNDNTDWQKFVGRYDKLEGLENFINIVKGELGREKEEQESK